MKLTRAGLAVLLVLPVAAGPWDQYPASVRGLLGKPHHGIARLTLRDGTSTEGKIIRVTDQYVTLSEAYRGGLACESFELSRIAAVKTHSDFPVEAAMAVVSLPFWLPVAVGELFKRRPFSGLWESVAVGQDGRVNRIVFGEDRYTDQYDFLVESGQYRLEGGSLRLTYRSGQEKVFPVRLGCDTLDLEGLGRPLQLLEWEKDLDGAEVSWSRPGRPGPQEWQMRTGRGHLFITDGGVTAEYRRPIP